MNIKNSFKINKKSVTIYRILSPIIHARRSVYHSGDFYPPLKKISENKIFHCTNDFKLIIIKNFNFLAQNNFAFFTLRRF